MGSLSIAKLTKWQLVDAHDTTNRSKLTPFDEVCLKSPFGHYCAMELSGIISVSGPKIQENTIFKFLKANIPYLPDWLIKRPYINHNIITTQYKQIVEPSSQPKLGMPKVLYQEQPKQLGAFPVDIQECFLIEDLLYAMSSIDGVYIKRKHSPTHSSPFEIEPDYSSPTCDLSLQYLVSKMLPLCTNHDTVLDFLTVHSQFEYGLVSHAVCAHIRTLLQDYLLMVTQLDTEF